MNHFRFAASAKGWALPVLIVLGMVITTVVSTSPARAAGMPVAVADSFLTTQSTPFDTPNSVLENDSLDEQALTWSPQGYPQHGDVEILSPAGRFTYKPAKGFSGVDSFEYCLAPLAGRPCVSNIVTVTITVLAAAPVDDYFDTGSGVPLSIQRSSVLANDQNANPGFLTWFISGAGPAHGTLEPSTDGQTLLYTPTAGFVGFDSFGYCLVRIVSPSCQTPTATIHINVGLPTTSRIAGADRFEVAAKVADAAFPATAPVVFVASGANYPDALSAAPAAVKLGGPLLLTLPDRIPDATAAKIKALNPSRIIIVGGPNSVSEAVRSELVQLVPGASVERISGSDRYEVSRGVANLAFGPFAHAFVVTGATFADALSTGAASGVAKEPVVLLNGSAQVADENTLNVFGAHATSNITIVGGPNSVLPAIESSLRSVATVTRIGGVDRFEASYNVNHAAFTRADTVYLATGLNYPDALAGGALAGSTSSPLYVIPKSCVPPSVLDDIVRLGAKHVVLLGGTDSLTDDVARLVSCN